MTNAGFENEEKEFWGEVLKKLADKISTASLNTWFLSATGRIEEGKRYVIIAATDFASQWITKRYKTIIFDVLKEMTGHDFKVVVKSQKGNNPSCNVSHNTLTEIPKRRALNLPLAKIEESNHQKRLRVENERIIRRGRRKG